MKRPLLAVAVLGAIGYVMAFGQSAPPAPSPSGLNLLKRVAAHYTNTKSYYIEKQTEGETSGRYFRQWLKSEFIAAEAPQNRFYYEGHSAAGNGIKVADGNTVWTYRPDEHRYIARPQVSDIHGAEGLNAMEGMAVSPAEDLRGDLEVLAEHLKSAERLPDASLMENGRSVSCYVVLVHNYDEIRPPLRESYDKTIWIEKEREIVLKIVEHHQSHSPTNPSIVTRKARAITTYTNTMLDGTPRDSLFTFNPPTGVRLARDFSDAIGSWEGSKAGDPVLPLRFKPAVGEVIPIESFRASRCWSIFGPPGAAPAWPHCQTLPKSIWKAKTRAWF